MVGWGVASAPLDAVFREQWPRVLAALVRYTGSIELAEDAVAEAFARAAAARHRELLVNPAAWVTTTAKRIAIDLVRRDAVLRAKLPALAGDPVAPDPLDERLEAPGGDDRLGLLFAACTPALPADTRLALSLRFVLGASTAEIADVLLVGRTAMSARLTRAKRRVEREGIRFAPDDPAELDARLADVLGVVHALYTLGHTAPDAATLGRPEVVAAAVELARALRRQYPAHRETAGLLALLLLTQARAGSRVDEDGGLVTLEEADRSQWDDALIHEGLSLAAEALPGMGRFALEAGIAGLHSQAPGWDRTDWVAIGTLYDRLVERWPSPAARLARVVARGLGPVGPEAALDELDRLVPALDGAAARQAPAARAELLRRAGHRDEAREAYRLALGAESNAVIRAFYGRRIAALATRRPLGPPHDPRSGGESTGTVGH